MTGAAEKQVYEQSGLGPEDLDLVELHGCFTANELITYEGLGGYAVLTMYRKD
jgi:sterol carrier protein 2